MSPLLLALMALDMGGAARDLARSVAVALAHEPATVAVRNASTLASPAVAEIRRVFDAELKAEGQPSAEVQVTISENLTQYLLVAEIRRGGERQVLMESWPRTPAPPAESVTLEKKLLWEQDQPILDAVRAGDAIVVLDAVRVTLIRGDARQSVPVVARHPWPRDMRGRLSASGAAFVAWLPGTVCRGSLQPQLSAECRESQGPWLLAPGALAAFSPAANYFPGRITVEPGGSRELAPFYSAAAAGELWAFAGVDGRTRIYTRAWEAIGETADWGSDIAAVDAACGPRVLATRAGKPGEPDTLQPYEIAGGAAHSAGRAVEFPGPITALWSAGGSATAVTHDLQTGRYAAYGMAPACGN